MRLTGWLYTVDVRRCGSKDTHLQNLVQFVAAGGRESIVERSMRVFARYLKKVLNSIGLDLIRLQSQPGRFFPYFLTKEVEGERFRFFIGDSDGQDWYDNGPLSRFWPEMRFMRDSVLSDGDAVLEVGAHHGFATILMSKWIGPNGKIISLEPNLANFEIAKINVQANEIPNVDLRNLAAGEMDSELEMDVSSSNSHVLPPTASSSRLRSKVHCVKLDSFLDFGPTLLKIDVEGFEKSVLDGAVEILKTRPKLLPL